MESAASTRWVSRAVEVLALLGGSSCFLDNLDGYLDDWREEFE